MQGTRGGKSDSYAHFAHLAPFEEVGTAVSARLASPFYFFDGGTGHQAFSRFSTALVASSSESTAT
jgi:hypothetical protein